MIGSINAMRVGLLTRWMGIIGIFAGILIFVPIGGASWKSSLPSGWWGWAILFAWALAERRSAGAGAPARPGPGRPAGERRAAQRGPRSRQRGGDALRHGAAAERSRRPGAPALAPAAAPRASAAASAARGRADGAAEPGVSEPGR